jgi:hypothetical protein
VSTPHAANPINQALILDSLFSGSASEVNVCHSSTAKGPPQHHAQKNFLHFLPDHALKIFFHFLPVCNISSKIAFTAAAQRQIATQKTAVLQLTAEEKLTSSRRCLTANKLGA